MKTIIIAGGAGFLGQALAQYWASRFHILILTRKARPAAGNVRYGVWDGRTLGPWAAELEGAHALVNLAGKSVDCRYTEANRREILQSRVEATRVLGEAVSRCVNPPRVWLQSSTATYYAYADSRPHTEQDGFAGHGFSVGVAKAWETAFAEACPQGVRPLVLRTAIVLGRGGGAYPTLRRLARCGLGGRSGTGRQMVSWIHLQDWLSAMDFLRAHPDASGVFNLCSPNPVTNTELQQTLRQQLGMPLGLPAPVWMLRMGAAMLGSEAELVLKSRYVLPARLMEAGFTFHYRSLREAVGDLEAVEE